MKDAENNRSLCIWLFGFSVMLSHIEIKIYFWPPLVCMLFYPKNVPLLQQNRPMLSNCQKTGRGLTFSDEENWDENSRCVYI